MVDLNAHEAGNGGQSQGKPTARGVLLYSEGYRRILDALSNLGYRIARGTVADILKQHGIEPAPERNRKTTWKEFLSRHWELIVVADFFTIEIWTRKGLQRFLVLFLHRAIHPQG